MSTHSLDDLEPGYDADEEEPEDLEDVIADLLGALGDLVEKIEHYDHASWNWPQYKNAFALLAKLRLNKS